MVDFKYGVRLSLNNKAIETNKDSLGIKIKF